MPRKHSLEDIPDMHSSTAASFANDIIIIIIIIIIIVIIIIIIIISLSKQQD